MEWVCRHRLYAEEYLQLAFVDSLQSRLNGSGVRITRKVIRGMNYLWLLFGEAI